MFPLSHMLKSFVRTGTLKVIDADGKTHVFAGKPGGPDVTMRLTDPLALPQAVLQSRAATPAKPTWTAACASRTRRCGIS